MELRRSSVAKLLGPALPSSGSIGQTSVPDIQHQLPSIGGAKKLYSEAVNASVDKRFNLLVKSKFNHSPEAIKSALRTSIDRTVMRVGIRFLKSLKDWRVLIEAGTAEELKLLST